VVGASNKKCLLQDLRMKSWWSRSGGLGRVLVWHAWYSSAEKGGSLSTLRAGQSE